MDLRKQFIGLMKSAMMVKTANIILCRVIDRLFIEDELKVVCRVEGDLTAVGKTVPILTGVNGIKYQRIYFDVVIWFGGPELLAELHWKENVSACEPTLDIIDCECQ